MSYLKPLPEEDALTVCLHNKVDFPRGSPCGRVTIQQALPVSGKSLLAIACRTFSYNGKSVKLVKPTPVGVENESLGVVSDSFVFDKENYGGKTLYLHFCSKWLRASRQYKLAERKAYQAADKVSESLEEDEEELPASQLPEQVELPFYNPSRKLGDMVGKIADQEDILGDY
ncbi:hypothetical protein GGI09_002331 [Coemansia sp. S100]|nr:hypothetical protein GGI09_002331 [Coemansia sp. S100]KAJ2101185.1 hypothetical protein GGI16_003515 [Coemansia sp. S142-1]